MKDYYVYILQCADGSYYTGVTNNIENRLQEHNHGKGSKYTSKRLPVKLVFQAHFNDIYLAIAFEKQVKGWSRAKKESLIANKRGELIRLASLRSTDRPKHPSSASG